MGIVFTFVAQIVEPKRYPKRSVPPEPPEVKAAPDETEKVVADHIYLRAIMDFLRGGFPEAFAGAVETMQRVRQQLFGEGLEPRPV